MYFKFYGFNESPFNLTPNSRFFFESVRHTEALSTLIYFIVEGIRGHYWRYRIWKNNGLPHAS